MSDQRSIGQTFGDIGRDLATLLRQEIALAKAEARQSATEAGSGIGMLAGAAVAGMLFLVFLSVAAWWALGAAIGRGWSGLIVAVIWAVIAAILAAVGRSQLKKPKGLPQTTDTVKKIPPALKGDEHPDAGPATPDGSRVDQTWDDSRSDGNLGVPTDVTRRPPQEEMR